MKIMTLSILGIIVACAPISAFGGYRDLKEEIEAALIRLIRRELNCRPSVVFLLQTPDAKDMATATHSSSPRRRRRSTASAAS